MSVMCTEITIFLSLSVLTIKGEWGEWYDWENCPSGSWVVRFQTRIEKSQGSSDDTALNAILMTCSDRLFTQISSGQQSWGDWKDESPLCPNGFSKFKLKIEKTVCILPSHYLTLAR